MEKLNKSKTGVFPLAPPERKRLFINRKSGKKERVEIVKWAANNHYDAVVFPLGEKLNPNSEYIKLIKRYELMIEAGGCDLSLLVPKKLFPFNKDLFRMESGKRKSSPHFCPTNHKTTAVIMENAEILFARSMPEVSTPRIFHLLPDKGYENVWCACPACRAFTPAEQLIITVNSAADALVKLDPKAWLSSLDLGIEPESAGVPLKKNVFVVKSF